MKKETVVITIHEGGRIEVAPEGGKGEECVDLTKFLEELGQASLSCHTPEYYEQKDEVKVTL